MREWTAGQKRFSFLVSQRLQGTIQFLMKNMVEALERLFGPGISSKSTLGRGARGHNSYGTSIHPTQNRRFKRFWKAEIAQTRSGFACFGTSNKKYRKNGRKTLFFHSQVRYYSRSIAMCDLDFLKEDSWLQV
jgi:hypothetical protein